MTNTIYVDWDGHYVRLTWQSKKDSINCANVTSAHGFCLYKGKVLLVEVKGRGWNIPGGHLERGETPQEAFHREAYEEGYVKGRIQYIGAIEVNHEENPRFDPKGKYPFIGYQMFYRMDIEECFEFMAENEAASRIWVDPEEVPQVIHDHGLAKIILKEALLAGEGKENVT